VTWRHVIALALCTSCEFNNTTVADEYSQPPVVGFEFMNSGADEQSGTLMINVVLSRPAYTPVSVSYSLLSGSTATQGMDFDLASGTLNFAAGEVEKEVPVTIKDDGVEGEPAETFDIALSNPVGATLDENRTIHEIKISDHILPRVAFDPTPTMDTEGTQSNLTIHLTRPSEGESTVVIGVAGGQPFAAGSGDYTIIDGTSVTIPNGATQVNVAIGEKDDLLDEEDLEQVVFTLKGASTNLVLGATKTLAHDIADNDDPPFCRFSNGTSSINENGVTRTQNVTLSTQSGRVVKVDVVRDDTTDTADNGDAAIFLGPLSLTFNPSETSKTIAFTVSDDNVDEDNETFIAQLTNLLHCQAGQVTHTMTINDNDTALVSFAKSSDSVTEGTQVVVTVKLSTPSSKTVTVPFSLNTGMTTATDGDDFTVMTASPLTFTPGVLTQTITIDVPDTSPGNEPDEFVTLDIGSVSMAGTQSPTRYKLTIKE
jgi:hypothetical protein